MREAAQEIMWAALPYSISLAILCLGCWCVREAIGPLEIIRYAFHGRLPYLDFYEFSREKMLPTKLCTVDFLHPSGSYGNIHYGRGCALRILLGSITVKKSIKWKSRSHTLGCSSKFQ